MTPHVRPALKADVRELSRTLARAFYDDPVMVWLMPEADKRTAGLSRLFATMTRHHHLAAAAWRWPPRIRASALRRCGIRPASGRRRPVRSLR